MKEYKDDLFGPSDHKNKSARPRILKLSPSTLNLFLECPRCFWLYLNHKIKRPGPPVATIATGMDRVIKEYFNRYRSKKILPPFLEGRVPGRLMERFPERGWLEFVDERNQAKLGGYLDECVQLDDKHFAAFDHKTRGSLPDSVHRAYQLQMDVYTFLLEENKFLTKNTAYIAYYVPKKIAPEFDFEFEVSVKEIATDPKRAKEVFYKAIEVLRNPAPSMGQDCEFCRWTDTLKIR